MALHQLIYASEPFGFDNAMLAGILLDARRCNARDGITGALIVRGDLYIQLLEGPRKKVEDCYHRIRADDRHANAKTLMKRTIKTRLFPDWAMKDDPAQSWVWSMDEVQGGAVDRATEDEALGFFTRLAAEGVTAFPPKGVGH
ncbi:MAG: BLUF domain-containing protein [Pseudomonadota bacterium]